MAAGCSGHLLTEFGQFETLEWSLEPEGGKKISLLDNEGRDPFQKKTDG
jgi:cytochrome c oxidase assembly factor 1